MSDNYDPVERLIGLLSTFDWEGLDVKVVRAYDLKNIDLRAGDYLIVERSLERDEFLGIGALEYIRYVTVVVSIMTGESRARLRKIAEVFRRHLRKKENWEVDGKLMLNVRIASAYDRSDVERGIYGYYMEVEWFEIEKVV